MEEDAIRELHHLVCTSHWQENKRCDEEFVFEKEDCKDCMNYDFCRAEENFAVKHLGKEVKLKEVEPKEEGGTGDGTEIPGRTGGISEGQD